MAQIDILTQQVALLTQAINDIYANAKTTGEFPYQSPLAQSSKVRVEDGTDSKFVLLSDIIDQASTVLTNKLLYFNGVTIVGNTVTLLAGSVWRVNNVIYSNIVNIPFTVPYVSTPGDFRKDLIIGGASNSDVTKITGSESDIAIEPNYPNDKVIICALNVTDSSISVDNASVPGLPEQIDREANGIDNFIDIGTTQRAKSFYYGSVLQEKSMWSQVGSVVTFTFVPDAGSGVNNLQFI